MTNIHIRPAQLSDADRLIELIGALAAHHGDTAEVTHETLTRDAFVPAPWIRVLCAENAGEVVGYAVLCPLARVQFGLRGMDMHHLYVDPRLRGRGVGRALIEACVRTARELDCSYLTVGTHPVITDAGQVYEACGFTRSPPPGPRFRMKLQV